VINVGISAYTQLQKLKGQEIDATDSDKAKNNVCAVCMRASRRKKINLSCHNDMHTVVSKNAHPSEKSSVASRRGFI